MYYEREDLGFSFELPDDWKEEVGNTPLTFFGPNGYIGYTSEVIQIQIATILQNYTDPSSREIFLAEPGAEISRGKVGDEKNVVVLEKLNSSELSVVRDGIHYSITYSNDIATMEAIKRLQESVKFPSRRKADECIQQWSDPRTQAASKALKSGSAAEARKALDDAGIPYVQRSGYTEHYIKDK